MSERATQLASFMAEYVVAANSHDVQRVLPLIADDATTEPGGSSTST